MTTGRSNLRRYGRFATMEKDMDEVFGQSGKLAVIYRTKPKSIYTEERKAIGERNAPVVRWVPPGPGRS